MEETHYYPFGLTMAGISSKAFNFGNLRIKKGYVGNEIQNNEFLDGSGLELYDFNARTYDPQTGRFFQIDPMTDEEGQESWTPFHYSFNNPIVYSDPDGKNPILPILWNAARRYAIRMGLDILKELPGHLEKAFIVYNAGMRFMEQNSIMGLLGNMAKSNQVSELEKKRVELEKSEKSLEKNVEEHKEKIEHFQKDPIKNSGEKWLENAKKDNPSEQELLRRANGRIEALKGQLKKNEGELKKVREKIKDIDDEIKKIIEQK